MSAPNENFTDLITFLSIELKSDYLLLAALDDPLTPASANTLVVYSHGKYLANFQYDLKGTPYEDVVRSQACVIPKGVAELFPDDVLLEIMGITGYTGTPLRERDGKSVGILVALYRRPISEPGKVLSTMKFYSDWAAAELYRIQTQRRLSESEDRFRTAFNLGPDIMCITNIEDDVFIDINEEFCRVTGFTRDEILGKSSLEFGMWADPEERDKMVQSIHDSGHIRNFEMKMKIKGGSVLLGLLSSTIIFVEDRPCLLSIVKDITEIRQVHEDLRNSLLEKELLLKELYHRVKNNLQLITSLLYLQSDRTDNRECRETLKICLDRIFSISAIHEQLYLFEGLTDIDFSRFLEDLTGNLVISHTELSDGISFHVEANDVVLDLESAIPCGMVVNELVSNAIKHAFPGGEKGFVFIEMSKDDDGIIQLRIRDDGIGIAANLDIRDTGTLGMHLVHLLVEKQLNGSLNVGTGRGTEFIIRFRKKVD